MLFLLVYLLMVKYMNKVWSHFSVECNTEDISFGSIIEHFKYISNNQEIPCLL
jgi:hypothetical protein